MKKFTQLGEPFQGALEGSWYVPCEKINGHFLTINGDIDLMGTPHGHDLSLFGFDTEQEAFFAADAYYTYHGFVYPYTALSEVEELLETVQSQVMEF